MSVKSYRCKTRETESDVRGDWCLNFPSSPLKLVLWGAKYGRVLAEGGWRTSILPIIDIVIDLSIATLTLSLVGIILDYLVGCPFKILLGVWEVSININLERMAAKTRKLVFLGQRLAGFPNILSPPLLMQRTPPI